MKKAKYTVKNPRKILRVMREFIDSAHELEYLSEIEFDTDDIFDDNVTVVKETYEKKKVKLYPAGRFCARLSDLNYIDETFRIGYDKEDIACNLTPGCSDFSVNIYNRCSLTKGFANITLVLLHELGHFCTYYDTFNWDNDKRKARIEEIDRQYKTRREKNFAYFKMPDETAATDWAITWLQDPEHRKMAKSFEKKFFACLEKNA